MPFTLEVQITLRQVGDQGQYYGNNELRVNEIATLPTMDFAQIAEVLGRFHELTEALKAAHNA
jgi:hypothetical protein